MAKKKWTAGDILTLILQVVAPLSSIIFTGFIPEGQSLSPDIKLAIVGVGIAVPIVILQYSVIIGQKQSMQVSLKGLNFTQIGRRMFVFAPMESAI